MTDLLQLLKYFSFYIALNLNCRVMLSHTLKNGLCSFAECIIKSSSPLAVYSQSSHFAFVLFHEVFCFQIIWTKSLCRLDFINIKIAFSLQIMYLLPQSSMMLYFFARSSLGNTLVAIELRNLMCRLFGHVFVGSVSLPLFDSLLGWTSSSDDFIIELSSFATASSQWRSCRCSSEEDFFLR